MSKRLLRVVVVTLVLGGVLAEYTLAQVVALPDDLEEPGISAPPSTGDTADSLFLRAKSAMAKKDYAAACVDFERSLALQRRVTALVNLANCRELNGELATAWRLFGDTIAALEKTSGAEADALRNLARQRAESLRPRLSGVIVKVPEGAPEGLQVLVNGTALRPEEFGQMLPKDGGTIYIRAVAPDVPPWSTTVDLEDSGDVEAVEVPSLKINSSVVPVSEDTRMQRTDHKRKSSAKGKDSGWTISLGDVKWSVSAQVGAMSLSGRLDDSDRFASKHVFGRVTNGRWPALGGALAAHAALVTKRGSLGFLVRYESSRDEEVVGYSSLGGLPLRRIPGVDYSKSGWGISYTTPRLSSGIDFHGSIGRQTLGFFGEQTTTWITGGISVYLGSRWVTSWSFTPLVIGKISSGGDVRGTEWGISLQYRLFHKESKNIYTELAWRQFDVEFGEPEAAQEFLSGYFNIGFMIGS